MGRLIDDVISWVSIAVDHSYFNWTVVSTCAGTGCYCLPQAATVYHMMLTGCYCLPQAATVYHRMLISTSGCYCLSQAATVYHRMLQAATAYHRLYCLPQDATGCYCWMLKGAIVGCYRLLTELSTTGCYRLLLLTTGCYCLSWAHGLVRSWWRVVLL